MSLCQSPKTPPGQFSSTPLWIPSTPRFAPIDEPDNIYSFYYNRKLQQQEYKSIHPTLSPTNRVTKLHNSTHDIDDTIAFKKPENLQTPRKSKSLKKSQVLSASHLIFPLTPEQTPIPKKRRTIERIQRSAPLGLSSTIPKHSCASDVGVVKSKSSIHDSRSGRSVRLAFPNAATAKTVGSGRASHHYLHTQTPGLASKSVNEKKLHISNTSVHTPASSSHTHSGTKLKPITPSNALIPSTPSLPSFSDTQQGKESLQVHSTLFEPSLPKRFIDIDTLFPKASPRKCDHVESDHEENFDPKTRSKALAHKDKLSSQSPKVSGNTSAHGNPLSSSTLHRHRSNKIQKTPGMWCVFRGKKVFRPFPEKDQKSWLDYKPRVLFPKAELALENTDFAEAFPSTTTENQGLEMFAKISDVKQTETKHAAADSKKQKACHLDRSGCISKPFPKLGQTESPFGTPKALQKATDLEQVFTKPATKTVNFAKETGSSSRKSRNSTACIHTLTQPSSRVDRKRSTSPKSAVQATKPVLTTTVNMPPLNEHQPVEPSIVLAALPPSLPTSPSLTESCAYSLPALSTKTTKIKH